MKRLITLMLCAVSLGVGAQIPNLGEYYGGGLVVWINPIDNNQGMVCDTVLLGSYAPWGCPGQTIETSVEVGSGLLNTLTIAAACPEQTTAATICLTSENGGYTDWHLPSKDELKLIYELHTELELTEEAIFAEKVYWSSSDFYGDGSNPFNFEIEDLAWGQNFSSGWQGAYLKAGLENDFGNTASDGFVLAVRYCFFNNVEEPLGCTDAEACNYVEGATADDGSCTYPEPTWCDCAGNVPDCAGNCGGTAVVDCAGVCGGSAVADCAGECGGNRVIDCAGVCGGTAVADCAGECGGDRVIDCAGTCGGSAVIDGCGECGGDNGSCSGCTNENATNYDSTASIEDGSCLYNQDAYDAGYDAGAASVECPPSATSDCPGDFTADGYIGVDDILSMLSLYDTSCSE